MGKFDFFWPKFGQKRIVGFKIKKPNAGKRISILEISCAPIFRKNGQLWIFRPKFAENWIFGSKFQKFKSGFKSASLRYYVHQFSNKTNNFEFLGLNFPKNWFWGRNFKRLILDSESTPPLYHVCKLSVRMDNILVQVLLRVLQKAGSRWMELDAGRCTVLWYPLMTYLKICLWL